MSQARPQMPTHIAIAITGEARVGKSALMQRYLDDVYKGNSRSFPGPDFRFKSQANLRIKVWDLPAKGIWSKHASVCYYHSDAIFFVYDITSKASFDVISEIFDNVQKNCKSEPPPLFIMVAAKSELEDQRVVSKETAKQKAEALGMMHYEVSSKNNEGVKKLFSDFEKTLYVSKKSLAPQHVVALSSFDLEQEKSFLQKHYKKIIGGLVAAIIIAAICTALWPFIVAIPFFGAAAASVSTTGFIASQGVVVGAAALAVTVVSVAGLMLSTFVGFVVDAFHERFIANKELSISAPVISNVSTSAVITRELGGSVKPDVTAAVVDSSAIYNLTQPLKKGLIHGDPVPLVSVQAFKKG